MNEFENRQIKIELETPDYKEVKLASGSPVQINQQAKIEFMLGNFKFTDSFLVLPKMNNIILGNQFFKKHSIDISPSNNLLKLPEMTYHLNEKKPKNGPRKILKKLKKFPIFLSKKHTLQPSSQTVLEGYLSKNAQNLENCSGVVIPNQSFEDSTDIALTSSLSTIDECGKVFISAINLTDHPITVPYNTIIANFEILNTAQAEKLINIDPQLIALAKMRNHDNLEAEINQLVQTEVIGSPKSRPKPEYDKLWFPTPETCSDPENLSPLEREIYDQISYFKSLEKIDPKIDPSQKEKFLENFNWENSVLELNERKQVEELLLEFSDIFAKHRFDVGFNTELKVKLTPEHELPVYVQSPTTPIHLRDELLVELALMHYYNLITTLPHSKYSSPVFAQRKESGKLRILIDLRRINHLLRNDYMNSNFPISNMSDASNHFAGKTLINKFDCSQAYHCVQMADEKSIQLLAFSFASRTYAYKCLAQGLSKSVTGFSSFIRHYLDPCLAANICTQYMDDIGSAVKNFDELIPNLRKIFECIRKSGLKLSPDKCEIGTQKIKFLGKYITPAGVSTENSKIEKFLKNLRMPQTVKQVKRLVGFLQFWRDFIPNLSQKLMPFYELLKKNVQHVITEKHEENLKILKNDLIKATNLTLRLAKPGLQYVLLCDASYYGTGFVLMIEDYVKTPNKKDRKTYAPVAFGSRLFNIAQLKFSTYYKEFLGLYFALDHFSHFIWGTEKPVIVLTDNKSLTQFFQAKTIPPSLWNCLDRLLSYNLVIAHIPGRANYAADFLSRVQSDLSTTIELKLTDRIPVREIEVQTVAKTPDASLSSIDSIDRMFDQQTTNKNDIFIHQLREQGVSDDLLEQIKQQTNKINQDIDEVQGYIRFLARTEINAVLIPDPNDYLSDLVEQNQPLNLKTEQEKDEVLKRVVKWKEENNVEDLTYASNELKKYRKQFRRLVLRDSILYRQFFDHTGRVQYHQYCLPKHLWKEVVYRLHNSRLTGHLGIVKTVEEFRKRFYFPNFTEYLISVIKIV